MRKPVEVIQGDKSLRLNLYLVVASYILLVILIEPLVDLVLLFFIDSKNLALIEQLNKLKIIASTLLYTVMGLIPAFFASWFAYRVIASSKLPPVLLSGKNSFPFTVVVIKGKSAKMFGVLILMVSLVLIVHLVVYAIKVLSF